MRKQKKRFIQQIRTKWTKSAFLRALVHNRCQQLRTEWEAYVEHCESLDSAPQKAIPSYHEKLFKSIEISEGISLDFDYDENFKPTYFGVSLRKTL